MEVWSKFHQIRSDQLLSRVWFFVSPWIAARQASLSITNSRGLLRLTSIYHKWELEFCMFQSWLRLVSLVQFSHSVVSNSVRPTWTAVHQASLSITNSWNLLKLMSIQSVMTSNHLILCHPLLLPSVFPSLFQWVSSLPQVVKVLKFQLQHQSFQWIFRTDFL